MTAYGSDCTNGSGTFAINTAAKPVYKLSAALQGILTFGQFEWFTDAQHTERLSFASELVWFLIDNGNTNENIEFVLMAIDAVMDGGSVDVDEKIINELTGKAKCVYDKVFSKNITSLGIMQQTYIAFNPDLNYKEHYLTYSSKPLSGTINGETKVNSPISYEIILNDQTLNNRAPIEIARTILHESVHALLLKQAYGDGTESFIQIFKNYISSTTGNNDLHHDIMRDKYIIPIAKGLEKYDNSSEDFSYYEHLAYFGLHQELNQQQLQDLNNAQNLARSKGLNCQ